MSDYWICLWALATGLWWLWAFIVLLAVACLAVTGLFTIIGLLDEAHQSREAQS